MPPKASTFLARSSRVVRGIPVQQKERLAKGSMRTLVSAASVVWVFHFCTSRLKCRGSRIVEKSRRRIFPSSGAERQLLVVTR